MRLGKKSIIAPGSDFALIVRTVGRSGERVAVTAALGIGLGCLFLLLLSIVGLNTILNALPSLRTIIRFAGAAWLIYQAVLSFLPHLQVKKDGIQKTPPLLTGLLNHSLNVEVILFYIAIVSQLSVHHIALAWQLLAALEMALFTVLWFTLLSYITSIIPNNEKILNYPLTRLVIGCLFLVSAVGLIRLG
jgi:threonine/homoserine/homoserine lactone efflux protein